MFLLCIVTDVEFVIALGYPQLKSHDQVQLNFLFYVFNHNTLFVFSNSAKLAFGKTVPVALVPTTGISKVSAVDFEYAKILRSTIKLVGTAILSSGSDGSGSNGGSGGKAVPISQALAVFVSPTMVPLTSPLASAKGPGNMVSWCCFRVGVYVCEAVADLFQFVFG